MTQRPKPVSRHHRSEGYETPFFGSLDFHQPADCLDVTVSLYCEGTRFVRLQKEF